MCTRKHFAESTPAHGSGIRQGNKPLPLKSIRTTLTLAGLLSFAAVLPCQAGDWLTYGHDPARSGWASDEKTLSPDKVSNLKVEWKTHVDNSFYSLSALTAPVASTKVSTPGGIRSVVYVAGISGKVFALDAESGEELWNRELKSMSTPRKGGFQGTFLCPNGITSTPVIDNETNNLYVIAADGSLYGLDLGTGKVKYGPVPFVSAFAKSWSLNLVAGTVYTSVSLGCGNGRSGVYAADVKDPRRPSIRQVMLSSAYTAGIWGRAGTVIGDDGKLYGGTADGNTDPAKGDYSDTVVAVNIPNLSIADYFLPSNERELKKLDLDVGSSSPLWFNWKGRNLLAHGFKEGVLYLLDADKLGGADHSTPLYASPKLANDQGQCCDGSGMWGSLALSRDAQGQTWIYAPVGGPPSSHGAVFPMTNGEVSHGSIMAFKVAADPATGKPILNPAWISGDFYLPEPPVIANGVVFALSNGENASQRGDESKRLLNTRPAVLRALDAATGKELYNSGPAFSSWVHFGSLAIAGGRVYAVDHDSNVYCFGLSGNTSVSRVNTAPRPRDTDELSTSWIGRVEHKQEFLKTWILRTSLTAGLVLLTAIAGLWAGSKDK